MFAYLGWLGEIKSHRFMGLEQGELGRQVLPKSLIFLSAANFSQGPATLGYGCQLSSQLTGPMLGRSYLPTANNGILPQSMFMRTDALRFGGAKWARLIAAEPS